MKKLKKYDWAVALNNLKKLVAKKVPLLFPNHKKNENDNHQLFIAKTYLFETDEFHPLDNEHEFEKSMDDNDWEYLEETLANCFSEIIQKIIEYFSNSWNFAPGYKQPTTLKNNDDDWWDKLECKKTDFLKFKKETFKSVTTRKS